MSSGSRMVEPTPVGIRERIKDLMLELKEKQYVCAIRNEGGGGGVLKYYAGQCVEWLLFVLGK